MSPHALAPDDPHLPRGVGIYVRRISRSAYGTPTEAARRAADHGLSFVAMPSVWQDDRGPGDVLPADGVAVIDVSPIHGRQLWASP